MVQHFAIAFALLVNASAAVAWSGKDFKKPSTEKLKSTLTPLQYSVTQESDTERPFKNPYWDEHRDGIYVDVLSGEPLYSSKDKFDSGTGWPSFTRPLVAENVTTKVDKKLFSVRTEVRSRLGDNHLGHVFEDGPPPTGKRYCMNSAALRFIPKEKLEAEGYPEYKNLFAANSTTPELKTVIFAGGCFWCMEPPFEKLNGVTNVKSGYSGGQKDKPTYEEVSSGSTGHREVVQVTYDPKKITLEKLLETYWVNIDPFDKIGEFCDKGEQYTSAIFYESEAEQKAAQQSLAFVKKNAKSKAEIATAILPRKPFFPAEDYHQDYYKKNPIRYKFYRGNCGRDNRLKAIWGDLAKH